MWIVRLALRRPYTFIVMALLIAIGGVLTIARTPVDIFPEINIPVISIIWQYSGLSPNEVEGRMVTISERAMTTTVNSIEHIESQSLAGVGLIRVFFQQDASIGAADAEVTAINQTLLRSMPPGTTPPLIIRYSASNVPIIQLALESATLSEQQLYDYGLNFIRTQLATVQGAQVPLPWGGKVRSVMVDLHPEALYAKGLSAFDVSAALGTQNVILPAGTAKIGPIEYNIRTNSSPNILETLNDLPVKQVGGATVYMRDVAQVRDGFAVQTNMVHVDGRLSALLAVLKTPTASTLDIVQRVKDALPRIQATLPPELEVKPLFDQSVFVRASLQGVLHALDAGDRGVDPARHPGLGDHAVALRRDAQRDDARWPGACRRHPRRRRDGRDREHEPEPRDGKAGDQGDPRRRPADRDAGLRRDALHLHRVRPGRVHHGRREVPLHAARRGGRLRDARELPALPHRRPDHGALPAPRRGTPTRPGRRAHGHRCGAHLGRAPGLQPPIRALAGRVRRAPRVGPRSPPHRDRGLRGFRDALARALLADRHGLLPDGGRRAAPPARPLPGRHAPRGERAPLRRRRGRDPPDHPRRRDRHHAGQHRPSRRRHQPGLQRRVPRDVCRRGDPDRAQAHA